MIKLILLISIISSVLFPSRVSAANGIGCGEGLGPMAKALCGLSPGQGGIDTVGNKLNTALSGIIGFLTIIAALWFAIQFIIAGFNWINAGGDKNAASTAMLKIYHSVIGLIIVVSAWVIIAVIGQLLGIQILNPGGALKNLQIK